MLKDLCILAALTLDKSKAQDSLGLNTNLGLSKVCVVKRV